MSEGRDWAAEIVLDVLIAVGVVIAFVVLGLWR